MRVPKPKSLKLEYVAESIGELIRELWSLNIDEYDIKAYREIPDSCDDVSGFFSIFGMHKKTKRRFCVSVYCKLNKKSMTVTNMRTGVDLY